MLGMCCNIKGARGVEICRRPSADSVMKLFHVIRPVRFVAIVLLAASALASAAPLPDQASAALMNTMQQELDRAKTALAKSDPAPYFLSYSIYDQHAVVIVGTYGTVITSALQNRRWADVRMRVGTSALDNTHDENRPSGITSGSLPISNDPDAIARSLWDLTSREYRRAVPAFLKVKTDTAVQAAEEDKSPDFSAEPPQSDFVQAGAPLELHQKEWENRIRQFSAAFRKYPDIYSSVVTLQIDQTNSYFVSSEGSKEVTPGVVARLVIEAETRADDGMDVMRVETFESPGPEGLPSEQEVQAKAEKMAADLKALRAAPVAEPYEGPALLSGRAAAVFFHEVLGHRLEGQRQRGEEEGQTFTKKINQAVLPNFLSVYDDPTLHNLNGVLLAGSYSHDDEGVPAERVALIQNGILKNFLMSRMPIANFARSNGHGRSQPGFLPTGRQGNLIVTSTKTVKDAEMRAHLLAEVKAQNKPYGLYFEDVEGGFTLTLREEPQTFQVLPVIVWRVYADGRPDQLVRGVDIVGTPLAALNGILVTSDTTQVFNGVCGAESGNVPVSAAAPAMLFSKLEVQKRAAGRERPPILPAPGFDSPAPGGAAKPNGEVR